MRSFALTFIYLNIFSLAASEEVSNASAQDNDCKHSACHVSGQSLLQHKIFDDVATKDEELDATLDERSLIAHRSDTQCDIGCSLANCHDGKCSSCLAGYGGHPAGKFAEKCKPCSVTPHCSSCAYRRRDTMCKDCNPGYVLQLKGKYIEGNQLQAALLDKESRRTSCEACAANCHDCTAPGTCTKCATGYVVNPSTSKCDKCADNCKTCQTAATCSECSNGYVLAALVNGTAPNGKWCDKCSANCLKCDTNGAGLCDVCQGGSSGSGYKLDPTTKLCVEEPGSLR